MRSRPELNNYNINIMSDSKDKLILYAGVAFAGFAALFGGLYVKNKLMFKPLPKTQVIAITKALRKPIQAILAQVINFYDKVKSQLPPEQFKHLVESQEGINLVAQTREINNKIASQHGTDGVTYEKSLNHYKNDPQVIKIQNILLKDYQCALSGQVNSDLFGALPQVSADKLLAVFKKVIQAQFLNTVETIKLTSGRSEEELMSDPQLIARLMKFENQEKQKIIIANGISSETDSAVQVYNLLLRNTERKDSNFRVKIKNTESAYQQILQKHLMAYQQSQNVQILNNLEDELIYMDS